MKEKETMDKLDKVIRGLKCSVCPIMPCGNCTYFVPNENDPDTGWCDRDAIYKDALELLKAQEPKKAKNVVSTAVSAMGECPSCGVGLNTSFLECQRKTKFCYNCGQAVKWYD